ncbi:MAG: SGNH/GDSL hydrolase family protein [Thermoguttaceae bacterium]
MKKWRLVFLLLLGILVIVGGWLYRQRWLPKPVGEGPAGPAVAREVFAETWTDRKVLLLGIGDSITAGFGVPRTHSYFGRLVKNPEDEFDDMQGLCLSAVLPNLEIENIAISGSTSLHHLQHVQTKLQPQDADVFGLIVMTVGGNDIIHDYGRRPPREGAMYGATLEQARPWIEAYELRLGKIVDRIEECFPGGCQIFLGDIYDPTDGVGDAHNAGLPAWPDGLAIHRAYNKIIHRCAAERASVHLVRLYDEFLGHGIHCTQARHEHYRPKDPHYWYASNLEDPNERGFDAVRRLFLIEIAKVADQLAVENAVELE